MPAYPGKKGGQRKGEASKSERRKTIGIRGEDATAGGG
jgi:hypothetical protein